MDRKDEVTPYSDSPTLTNSAESDAELEILDPQSKSFFSGEVLVALLIGIGIILAASGWLYHYESRRVPQTFWGFESPKIFREAKKVTAFLIRPEEVIAGEKPKFYDKLFMIDELRYVSIGEKVLDEHPSFGRVRELLTDYSNYKSTRTTWANPVWRFALQFHNKNEDPTMGGDYTAVIVFDEDCKLGRPQSVGKTIDTAPMAAELLAYFEGIFPDAKEMKDAVPADVFARPLVEPGTEPTPTATAPVDATVPAPPVAVVPMPTPTAPTTFGPALPDYSKPVPPPVAVAVPAPPAAPIATAAPQPPRVPSGNKTSPFTVGPAVVPQIPGLPGMPSVGGPLSGPPTLNLNSGGSSSAPANPLLQGLPQPAGTGGSNLSTPPSISLPPLKGVPAQK